MENVFGWGNAILHIKEQLVILLGDSTTIPFGNGAEI